MTYNVFVWWDVKPCSINQSKQKKRQLDITHGCVHQYSAKFARCSSCIAAVTASQASSGVERAFSTRRSVC